jgi:hypothetical protein
MIAVGSRRFKRLSAAPDASRLRSTRDVTSHDVRAWGQQQRTGVWQHLRRRGSRAGDQAGALSQTTAAGRSAGHKDNRAAKAKAPLLLCRCTMIRW